MTAPTDNIMTPSRMAPGRRSPHLFFRERLTNLGMRTAGQMGTLANAIIGRRVDNSLGILTYHRIEQEIRGFPSPMHNVTPWRFREQLIGLRKRGYRFVSLRTALDVWETGQPFPEKRLVVTFDDGFESVYHNAWPVLRELDIPATIFLNTAYLGNEMPFPFDAWGVALEGIVPPRAYRPLRLDQCREMLGSSVIDLGAHTHTHADFRKDETGFRQDLRKNIECLREWFGLEEPLMFAFPFGGRHSGFASDTLVEAAREVGVRCSLTTEAAVVRPLTPPNVWGRFNVFPWDTPSTLAAKVNGWYGWAPRTRQWLARMTRRWLNRTQEPSVVSDHSFTQTRESEANANPALS